jgi:hypothetical protein
MRSSFNHPGRAVLEFSPQERTERLTATTPRQRTEALLFLAGYSPAVFDAILDAVEPFDESDDPHADEDAQPTCAVCREHVGIFLLLGLDWRHYRGVDPGGPFEIFDAGHDPIVTWHPAARISSAAS